MNFRMNSEKCHLLFSWESLASADTHGVVDEVLCEIGRGKVNVNHTGRTCRGLIEYMYYLDRARSKLVVVEVEL